MNSNSSAILVPPPSSASTLATNDIHDIRSPVPIPNYWLFIFLVLTFVWLAAAAFGFWLWLRKKRAQVPPIPVVPPHVRARHKLANALALLQDPRQFCTLVSDTLRHYLEERFDFHAPERTTEEFLIELQDTNILNVDQKQRLAEFLEQCDLVKFAKFEPTENQLRGLLEAALRLIDETQYVTTPSPVSANVQRSVTPTVPPLVPAETTPSTPEPVTRNGK